MGNHKKAKAKEKVKEKGVPSNGWRIDFPRDFLDKGAGKGDKGKGKGKGKSQENKPFERKGNSKTFDDSSDEEKTTPKKRELPSEESTDSEVEVKKKKKKVEVSSSDSDSS